MASMSPVCLPHLSRDLVASHIPCHISALTQACPALHTALLYSPPPTHPQPSVHHGGSRQAERLSRCLLLLLSCLPGRGIRGDLGHGVFAALALDRVTSGWGCSSSFPSQAWPLENRRLQRGTGGDACGPGRRAPQEHLCPHGKAGLLVSVHVPVSSSVC